MPACTYDLLVFKKSVFIILSSELKTIGATETTKTFNAIHVSKKTRIYVFRIFKLKSNLKFSYMLVLFTYLAIIANSEIFSGQK